MADYTGRYLIKKRGYQFFLFCTLLHLYKNISEMSMSMNKKIQIEAYTLIFYTTIIQCNIYIYIYIYICPCLHFFAFFIIIITTITSCYLNLVLYLTLVGY